LLRFIVNFILRVGIIELFLVFFVFVNGAAFFIYIFCSRKPSHTTAHSSAASENTANENATTNDNDTNYRWRIWDKLLLLVTLACGGIGAFAGICLPKRIAKHRVMARKYRITVVIGLAIAIIPLVHIAHGLTLDRSVRYVEIEFTAPNWPAELDGYRIAFMTDMHIISDESMRAVASELSNRNIDLLLLGGDFSTRDSHYQGTLREIAQTVTTDGIFGVEGNHDFYAGLFYAKLQHGITPLDNSGVHIREGFFLAGVHDMWNRNPSVAEATAEADPGDFVLLLSHNPDVAMVQSTVEVDLMISGHTHGGQITFFGFPMYLFRGSITDYGTRFAYGFSCSADEATVFVSRGIGPYYTIPRIFARPEVVIFTMRRG